MASESAKPQQRATRSVKQGRKRHIAVRWLRAAVWTLFTLLLLVLVMTGSLFWWAGTDGSLATALRWAGKTQPLTAQGATGALLADGHIDTLAWQQDGLAVTARDVRLNWQPMSLLEGELTISQLAVGQLTIDDQRPASIEVPAEPPIALQLPLPVTLNALTIGKLDFQGAATGVDPKPVFAATNIAGRYTFDGLRHTLVVSTTQIAAGTYKATATLLADAPMTLSARVDGTLQAKLPAAVASASAATVPMKALLTAKGTLTDLQVNAEVEVVAPTILAKPPTRSKQKGSVVKPTPPPLNPQAKLQARVTPWAKQPVAAAEATFRDLDVAAFMANAPQTLLTGMARVQPLTPQAPTADPAKSKAQFWALQLHIGNALSGPWDQQRLPLEQVDTEGQWRDGVVTLQSLKARLGGGEVVASGQWSPAAATAAKADKPASGPVSASPGIPQSVGSSRASTPAAQNWALQATLKNVDPALLHTAMAPDRLDGTAEVKTVGEAIGFDVTLNGATAAVFAPKGPALASRKQPPRQRANASGGKTQRMVNRALRLRDAKASGSWQPQATGGTLTLSALQVRTNDATLAGKGAIQPFEPGGNGQLTFTAPGLEAQLQGDLYAATGKGSLNVRGQNAAALLAWLRTLPGMPPSVLSAEAAGSGALNASWSGGWRDPAIVASLDVPLLDLRLADSATPPVGKAVVATADTGATPAAAIEKTPVGTLKLQTVQAKLSGKLSQAQLSASGNLMLDQRRITLQLVADGGRSTAGVTLARSSWQGSLRQLVVTLADPALGSTVGKDGNLSANSVWTLATRGAVAAKWLPLAANGTVGGFESGVGLATLSAPAVSRQSVGSVAPAAASTAKIQPAVINWQPVRWRPNALASAGTVTGLPLAWAEVLAGPQLASTGVSGDLLFNGEWDALFTDTLRLNARLARASGDLIMKANNAEGVSSVFSAGIRQAEIALNNSGDALNMALRWDSERAGSANGSLTTRLSRAASLPATTTIAIKPAKPSQADTDKLVIVSTTPNAPGLGGWTWPASAPLNGQLRAQLPKVGVWSVLAPPGWRLRGSLGADIAISGTRGAPQLAGTLQADDMALRSVVDGFEFGSGKLRARLDGTRLVINEFTLYGAGGPSGGGVLTAQGEASLVNGKPNVLLDAKLKGLRASIRTDRQLTLSGDLQARLRGTDADITGALVVDQALIELPDENTPQLGNDVVVRRAPVAAGGKTIAAATPKTNTTATPSAAAAQQQQKEQKALEAPLQPADQNRPVKLAVALDLGNNFRVRGKGIDTRVRGTLTVSGDTTQGPRLVGSLNTVGGQYRAYGQRLDVERGVLRFTGALDNPTLDILALRADAIQVSQRVGVQITGSALLPRIRLYARPDLPDADKLAWLITGKPAASGGAEAALLQQAALALLGSKTGDTGGGLASSLGLDELSFKGGSSNADGSTSEAAVTLGKRFSRNFYAAYERSVSGALGTLYIFYDLSKRLTVRAQAGQQSAVDLIYTLHYD